MIVLDIETTGDDPKNHSITSLGSVDTNKLIQDLPDPVFYGECIIWPGAKIQEETRDGKKVHPYLDASGFSEEDVRYLHDEIHENLLKRWKLWTKDSINPTLCGENVNLDIRFMREGFARIGYKKNELDQLISPHGSDILTLAYEDRESRTNDAESERGAPSLDETLEYVGLPPSPRPYNALIGAILAAEVRWRIKFGQSLFAKRNLEDMVPHCFPERRLDDIPKFSKFSIPDHLSKKHK